VCYRLLSNAVAKLAKIDSGTCRSTVCSELSAYQHMLLVDLLVPLCKTHVTSELSTYGPRSNGVARREVGARAPGRRPLERTSTHFADV